MNLSQSDYNLLRRYEFDFDTARIKYVGKLKELYPKGTSVDVLLCSHQKTPTHATIHHWHVDGSGYATVQLDSVNRHGNNSVKQVHYTQIVGDYEPPSRTTKE